MVSDLVRSRPKRWSENWMGSEMEQAGVLAICLALGDGG